MSTGPMIFQCKKNSQGTLEFDRHDQESRRTKINSSGQGSTQFDKGS